MVPISFAADVVLKGYKVTVDAVAGAALLGIGFVSLAYLRSQESEDASSVAPDGSPAHSSINKQAEADILDEFLETDGLMEDSDWRIG